MLMISVRNDDMMSGAGILGRQQRRRMNPWGDQELGFSLPLPPCTVPDGTRYITWKPREGRVGPLPDAGRWHARSWRARFCPKFRDPDHTYKLNPLLPNHTTCIAPPYARPAPNRQHPPRTCGLPRPNAAESVAGRMRCMGNY
jgi:hypothetical protein